MKRYVRSSNSINFKPVRIKLEVPGTHSKYVFQGQTDDAHGFLNGQITKIAPYDDADYFWAKIENNGQVKFIQAGKIVDKMQLWSYEEDEYESVEEYYDTLLEETIKELDQMNKKIKPVMMYD